MNRKQWKAVAHAVVKKHYVLLIAVCLTAVMFNVEFGALPTTTKDFYLNMVSGIHSSVETIFLELANMSPIGHLMMKSYTVGLQTGAAFRSDIPLGLLSCLVPIIDILIFIFLLQIIRIILRRIFLEARMYDQVPLQHVLYLTSVKKWAHTAIAYFEYAIRLFLWSLTIIGGPIKFYSYFCTPFILAENPSLTSVQAISLSRKMMDGHKKEAFVLDLSMIGWYLLNFVTAGLAGIFYVNAYTTAVHAEYYAYIRSLAKQQEIENNELLNDTYLFEKADAQLLATTYKSTRMDEMYIADTEVPLTGAKKFFAEDLSLWTGSSKQRKVYQGVQNLKYQLEKDKAALNGEQYPSRLNPLYTRENIHFDGNLTVDRAYSFTTIILLFLFSSAAVWLMHGAFFAGSTGTVYKYGVLAGPWLPMYGAIGVVSLMLFTKARKNPVLTLCLTTVTAGLIQYFTSYFLETKFNAKWWDFSNYYLNLNGRTCLQYALAAALICMLFFYIIAPLFDQWLSRKNPKIVLAVALILLVLFIIDAVYSCGQPNYNASLTMYVAVTKLL